MWNCSRLPKKTPLWSHSSPTEAFYHVQSSLRTLATDQAPHEVFEDFLYPVRLPDRDDSPADRKAGQKPKAPLHFFWPPGRSRLLFFLRGGSRNCHVSPHSERNIVFEDLRKGRIEARIRRINRDPYPTVRQTQCPFIPPQCKYRDQCQVLPWFDDHAKTVSSRNRVGRIYKDRHAWAMVVYAKGVPQVFCCAHGVDPLGRLPHLCPQDFFALLDPGKPAVTLRHRSRFRS